MVLHPIDFFISIISLLVHQKVQLFTKQTIIMHFEKRPLYFICDPVHLLKTTRNNWENSFWRNKTKKLRNSGMWITWLQLIDAFENDVNSSNVSGLRLLHKLTADHIFLNPCLRMRVYLAAQVFSNRVAHAQSKVNQVQRRQLNLSRI